MSAKAEAGKNIFLGGIAAVLILMSQSRIASVEAAPADTTATSGNPAATPLALWPSGKMPGHSAAEPEHEMPSRGDGVIRLTGVSNPTLTIHRPPASAKATPAVIVCPGGGYKILAMNKEGSEIAMWLNSLGITAFVLKYRVPDNREGALQDLERAVRLVRAHKKEWNADAAKVGVMGFSAGGHLCAHLSTTYEKPAYSRIDTVDRQSCRPDFAVLVYPAYLGTNGQMSAELPVSKKIPPTLIIHSGDDTKYVAGSKIYDAALTSKNVPHEFILFQTGGHGYGLQCTKEAKAWPERCREWLNKVLRTF